MKFLDVGKVLDAGCRHLILVQQVLVEVLFLELLLEAEVPIGVIFFLHFFSILELSVVVQGQALPQVHQRHFVLVLLLRLSPLLQSLVDLFQRKIYLLVHLHHS